MPPSSEHSNVAPAVLEENANDAEPLSVAAGGPESIAVWTASTVN